MRSYHAPTDDILFSLEHVAGAGDLADWDTELTREVAGHFAQLAEGVIAPTDEEGDIDGCKLVDGRVRMPKGFHGAYAQIVEGGWQGLTAPEAYGGQGISGVVSAAVSEIFSGANHSLQMITGLVPGAISTILAFGSEAQKDKYIPFLAEGAWLSTMCLTEPGSGSDLSSIRTKAVQNGELWSINGEKIFISGGDQDLTDDTLHLVLARTGETSDGVRGLSLFLCPSIVDDERNSVNVVRIEEKMGLHASPTCQMVFDNAKAELIGEIGQGLIAMFTMMNHARLDVALQGVAHAARATDISRSYAADRIQGKGKNGQPVAIDQHPDVIRMVDEQDALTLGGRAMSHIALVELEKGSNPDLVEFLTPICKAFCSDAGTHAADLSIQVLGGYGYLQEYRAEQNYRDARICSIYEGTNGIHAISLATRLLTYKQGVAADAFARFVEAEAAASKEDHLSDALEIWRKARQKICNLENPAAAAHSFLQLTSEVLFQAAWVRIASVADRADNPDRIRRLAQTVKQRSDPTIQFWSRMLI
jgi:alkylation response protein AidB-like acyl-CoA dehydrogenase